MPDLTSLAEAAHAAGTGAGTRSLPPVHLWNPPFCGDIDMEIRADGTWFYQGTPIGRPALVRLFASILRKDPERYVLVTPVERVGIRVADAPFVAVGATRDHGPQGPAVRLATNVEDEVVAGPAHALRFEPEPTGGLRPYVHIRRDLWARCLRPVYYDLVAWGEVRVIDGTAMFGVASDGAFFPMIAADALDRLGDA
jgi:hypothetical protein